MSRRSTRAHPATSAGLEIVQQAGTAIGPRARCGCAPRLWRRQGPRSPALGRECPPTSPPISDTAREARARGRAPAGAGGRRPSRLRDADEGGVRRARRGSRPAGMPILQFVHLIEGSDRAGDVKAPRGNFITLDELLTRSGLDATRFFMLQRRMTAPSTSTSTWRGGSPRRTRLLRPVRPRPDRDDARKLDPAASSGLPRMPTGARDPWSRPSGPDQGAGGVPRRGRRGRRAPRAAPDSPPTRSSSPEFTPSTATARASGRSRRRSSRSGSRSRQSGVQTIELALALLA